LATRSTDASSTGCAHWPNPCLKLWENYQHVLAFGAGVIRCTVINDRSIDAGARAVIRYSLEINDPCLADLVRRVDAGKTIIDESGFLQAPAGDSNERRVEVLTEMICRTGDESAAALLILMATLENTTHPKGLANMAKHIAFTHCGRSNLYGMVDAQIALLEIELLGLNTLAADSFMAAGSHCPAATPHSLILLCIQ
jgi:hypothetical protein